MQAQQRMKRFLPYVHATFRTAQGELMRPKGLQWHLPGISHVHFVLPESDASTSHGPIDRDDSKEGLMEEESSAFRQGLVESYNRWSFAKDLPFKTVNDILSIQRTSDHHFQVEWKDSKAIEKITRFDDIARLLREALETSQEQMDVWIHGEYVGKLTLDSMNDIVAAIPQTANRMAFKQSHGRIRIERYYRGALRKPQVWDHIWDNLVALEDPQILDERTIIGTATLRDWIMGGNLTSRLWIQDRGDSILFLRPLHNDDIFTSDRRYELKEDQEKLERAREEIQRLRYLSTLTHPFETRDEASSQAKPTDGTSSTEHERSMQAIRAKLKSNRTKKNFFGI